MPAMTSHNPENSSPPPPPPPPPPPSLPLPPLPTSSSPSETTRTPTRRLQWLKIPEVKIKNSDNIWSIVEKSKAKLDVNTHKVQQLFSYKVTNHERLSNRFQNSSPVIGQHLDDVTDGLSMRGGEFGERSSFNEKRKRVEEINLLDFNRSRNVCIFLRSLNMNNQQVVTQLCAFDWQAFDTDTLKTLVRLMPTEQDSQLLNSFTGDVTRLGAAERFFLSLLQLPSHQLLAELLLLTQELQQLSEVLLPAMKAVKACVRAIRESEAFRSVLHVILAYGNLLNNGATAGGAAGFSLESLSTLTDLKTNDQRTLMHVIAYKIST